MRIGRVLREGGVRITPGQFWAGVALIWLTCLIAAPLTAPGRLAGFLPHFSGIVEASIGAAPGAHIELMDIVVRVDGQALRDSQDLFEHYAKSAPGQLVMHEVWRDGKTLMIPGRVEPFGAIGWLGLWWPCLLFGLTCAGLGSFLAWRAARLPEASIFSRLLGSLSVAAVSCTAYDTWMPSASVFALSAACSGGLFIQLAQQLGPRRAHSRWPLWLSAGLALISYVGVPVSGSATTDSGTIALMWQAWNLGTVYWPLPAGAVIFPVMVGLNMRGHQHHELYYQQNRVILWSTVGAFAPVCAVWLPLAWGGSVNPTLANASLLLLTLLPVGTFFAVLRYKLFALDNVLRRTISYAVTIALLALAYTGAVAVMAQLLRPQDDEVLRFLLVMAVALAFDPFRRRVRRQVDRWFDKGRLNILEVQRMINRRAAEHHDTSQTLDGIAQDLREALRLNRCALALPHEEQFWLVAGEPELLGQTLSKQALPAQQHWSRAEHPDFPWPADIVAGYTIHQSDKAVALIFLGEKRSQEPLTSQDFDYLGLVSGQIGLLLSYTQMLDRQQVVDREMQKLLSKVSELNDLRSSFGIVAGHELRTPLTVIKGHAELLLSGSFGDLDDQQMESVQSIHRSASIMATQISAYLDLVALREKRLVLRPAVCDLGTITYEALEPWDAEIDSKSLSLRVDVSGADKVFADSRRVRQVIEQLVSNAVKFTPKGGSVLITAHTKDRQVLLTIQDNGPGIPADFLDRAFDDFAQVADPTQRDHGGLGLGLPLVKALMDVMQGRIEYALAPEGGSVFTCSFPRPQATPGRHPSLLLDQEMPLRTLQVFDEETGLWKVRPDVQERDEPTPGITLANVVYETPPLPDTDPS